MIVEEVKATEKNKSGEELKKWIKKNAKSKMVEVFKRLEAELMNV